MDIENLMLESLMIWFNLYIEFHKRKPNVKKFYGEKYDWIKYFEIALLYIPVVVVGIKYKICKICC